jgi:TonB family protein
LRAIFTYVIGAAIALSSVAAQAQTFEQLDSEVTTLRAQGKKSLAIDAARRLVDLTERTMAPLDSRAALSLTRLALVYEDAGRYPEAEDLMRRAFAIVKRDKYANPNPQAALLGGLAKLASEQGRDGEAADLYREALTLLNSFPDANRPTVIRLQIELGVLYAWSGDTRAEGLLRSSYEALSTEGKGISPETVLIFRSLGRASQANKDYDKAAQMYEMACEIAERAKGSMDPLLANCLHDLATNWVKAGKPLRGEVAQSRALAIFEGSNAVSQQNFSNVLTTMAQIKKASGNLEAAHTSGSRALELRTRLFGDAHPGTFESAILLADIEEGRGRLAEAKALRARAYSIHDAVDARSRRRPVNGPMPPVGLRPEYPPEAKRFGHEGKVVVRALVSADGTVAFVNIQESSGFRSLDDAALKAVLGARFSPATNSQGQQVGADARVPINFVLTPAADAAVLSYGQIVAAALRKEIVYPDVDLIPGNPAAVILVRLAPDGMIQERTLKVTSGIVEWDAAVLRAIDKVGTLPVDSNGTAPPKMELSFRPKI